MGKNCLRISVSHAFQSADDHYPRPKCCRIFQSQDHTCDCTKIHSEISSSF